MSKISEYLQELDAFHTKKATEEATVNGYAKALNQPVERLIELLNDAGLKKNPTDPLNAEEKGLALEHLRRKHSSGNTERKKITIQRGPDHIDRIVAVAGKVNGAEWEALEEFAFNIAFDNKITPNLQRLINLIVAKAFFTGALPDMRKGRPKSEETENLGREIACRYWNMRDAGKPYAEAVSELSERFHKDERHVMRIVKQHTPFIGETKSKRDWWRLCSQFYSKDSADGEAPSSPYGYHPFEDYSDSPEFDADDFIERIEEQILAQMQSLQSLT